MIECILATVLFVQPSNVEAAVTPTPLQFSVTHDGSQEEILSGRLYIMLTKRRIARIGGPDWFHPEPFFALDVVDWEANVPLLVADNADAMVGPLSSIGDGPWKGIAILRKNNDSSRIASVGGVFSKPFVVKGGGSDGGTIKIVLQDKVPDREWVIHKKLRLAELRSPLLSAFYGRDLLHKAGIIVPEDYDPNREEPYPVMYWIGGFGSDHFGAPYMASIFTASDYDDQVCRVILNAQTYSGHHVFADSENNGPRMTALLTEFIPYIEEKYNLGGSPSMRYVAGHSSGGWASLWLVVKNPEFFAGVWSLAPDPIDFHYFQTVDLYEKDANMYVDAEGQERPIARKGTTPVLFAKGFVAMDDTIKLGGQIGSFEWVFSPRGLDGQPMHMFNRETGAIIPEVVEYWKRYDIRRYLEDNWEVLAPKLAGKINIIVGSIDTFYLEGAVIALRDYFEEKSFDASVQVVEGWDHGGVFRTTTLRGMDEWFARQLGLENRKSPIGPVPANE